MYACLIMKFFFLVTFNKSTLSEYTKEILKTCKNVETITVSDIERPNNSKQVLNYQLYLNGRNKGGREMYIPCFGLAFKQD